MSESNIVTSIEQDKSYLFFTLTYFYAGTVVRVTPTDVVLRDCSIVYGIASLDRFFKASTDEDPGTLCEEVGFLGDFILRGFTGAREISVLPRRNTEAKATAKKEKR